MSELREELPQRLRRMGERLSAMELSGGLFWDPATVCYLTGNEISGPNLVWLEPAGAAHVFCDEYDAYNVSLGQRGLAIHPTPYWEDPLDRAIAHMAASGGARIGIERKDIRAAMLEKLSAGLASAEFVPLDAAVAAQRLVKSDAEEKSIRRAAGIVGEAYAAAAKLLAGPTSEREIAAAVFGALIAGGSDYVASQPYIKSGERALQTHARWGDRAVAPEDHVLLEIGASVHRYHAALMRTRLPARRSPALRKAVDAVRAGRDAHLAALRPGVSAGSLHAVYLEALDRYGVKSWNRHSSGYSFGIAYPPYWGEIKLLTLTRGVERKLEPGMALHVISGVTEPDAGVPHVGLSECVLVTEHGYEPLIGAPDFL